MSFEVGLQGLEDGRLSEREAEFVSRGWDKIGESTRAKSGKFEPGDVEAESV